MSVVNVEFPNAHSDLQAKIFDALSHQGIVSEVWVACGTKFGKTLAASVAMASQALKHRQKVYRWVAPTYSQAMIGKRYCQRIMPPTPYVEAQQYKIIVPNNDTIIEFRSGDRPENLEGEAVHGYVLDEAAKLREDVYSSARTTLTQTRGPMLNISTPRGKNWFYHRCMRAREIMDYDLSRGRIPRQFFFNAATTMNPTIAKETIEDMRKSLPDRLFRQYVLAEFVDEASTFSHLKACINTSSIEFFEDHQIWTDEKAQGAQVVVGVDWAKSVDYTVFIAIDIVTKSVIGFERFHKAPYTEAIRHLVRFSKRFSDVISVYHDKTGVGSAIDDQLAYTDLNYVGVVFSNSSKSEMVTELMTAFESEAIKIPDWNVLIAELEAYEVTQNASGTLSYNAPSGLHDDAVCALMLANRALNREGHGDSMDIRFLENLKDDTMLKANLLSSFYLEDYD
jgi:hypothetical protein